MRGFVAEYLDPENAACIVTAQEIFKEPNLKNELGVIRVSSSRIPQIITALENAGAPLVDAVRIVDNFANEMGALKGRRLLSVRTKTNNVFQNNTGLQQLQQIAHILLGNIGTFDGSTVADVSDLRFAPIMSADVERSSSRHKSFLRDDRRAFDFENLKKYVVTLCD